MPRFNTSPKAGESLRNTQVDDTCPRRSLSAVDADITAAELEAHLSDANTAKLLETVGIYAFAYEIVSSTVVENVSGFFTTGLDEKGWTYDEEWDEVRSKHRHELSACLDWLVDQDVLSEEEAASVDALRKERNR